MAQAGLEGGGQLAAKLRLALGVAGPQFGIADREAPVLAFEQQGLAVLIKLSSELPGCLRRHVALGRRRREQRDPVAHRCVDALLEERHEEFGLAGECQ